MFLHKNLGIFSQLPLLFYTQTTIIESVVYDDSYTVLNINADTLISGALTNDVFIDSSYTLSNVGTVTSLTQGTFSPYSRLNPQAVDYDYEIHGGSAFLNGSSYLSATTESDLGTDPFTIECWVYPTGYYSTNKGAVIISHRAPTAQTETWRLSLGNNTNPDNKVSFWDGSSWYQGSTLPLSTWNHIAIVRTSSGGINNLTMYINGIGVTPTTVATNYQSLSVSIGVRYGDLNEKFMGYISNLRIIKQAIYTSNFTPPIRRVTETSNGGAIINGTEIPSVTGNTLLLLDFTNAGIIDTSIYNRHIIAYGNINTTGGFSKFGSGSLSFRRGTTDYLNIPTDPNLTLDTSDFTIEFWIYRERNNANAVILDYRPAGTSTLVPVISVKNTPNNNNSIVYNISNVDRLSAPIPFNQWAHVSVVKNNNQTRLFVNGVSASGQIYTDNNNYIQPASGIWVGRQNVITPTHAFEGALEDIRITKGVARYTSNFTLPAKLAANYTDPHFNNVVVFINGNNIGSDQNSHFRATKAARGLTSVNNNIPTQGSYSPFFPNGWSIFFDGLSSYIYPTTSVPLLTSNTQPFTFETWFYRVKKTKAGSNTFECIFGSYQDSSNGFNIRTDEGALTIRNGDSSIPNLPTVNINENVWYHLAISGKPGTSLKFFLNGVLRGETSSAVGMTGNNPIVIGNLQKINSSNPDCCFSGYISNLRFIQGLELYTSDFTPPKQKLQKIEENGISTVILACQDGIYKDNGSNNFTMDYNGNASTLAFNPLDKTQEYLPKIHGGSGFFKDKFITFDKAPQPAASTNRLFGISSFTDFTIELFVNLNSNTTTLEFGFISQMVLSFVNGKAQITGGVSTPASSNLQGKKILSVNTWYHVVFTREYKTRRIFINGILDVSAENSIGSYVDYPAIIGHGFTTGFNGYISNYRYVKGKSLYTTNFIPPTGLLTAVNGTVLLYNFNNANLIDTSANTNISFSSKNNPTITNSDFAPINSSIGSLQFNNTLPDALSIFSPNPNLFRFSNDFTMEMWVKYKSSGTFNIAIISNQISSSQSTPFIFWGIQNSTLRFGNTVNVNRITSPIVANVWHHIALTRELKTYRMFIDGIEVGSYTEESITIYPSANTSIGQWSVSNISPFNGLMDDIRIINGKAIYTKNFTPITT